MYYSKEQLDKIREQGEEHLKRLKEQEQAQQQGFQFKSSLDLLIKCQHCGHDRFEEGRALLNTRGLTFFDLDWLNEGAYTLMCKNCGLITWFGKEIKQVE